MAYENAKRIVKTSDARISRSTSGIYDDNLTVVFWENIEAAHIDECIRYLNDTTQRTVTGPVFFYDVKIEASLHHLHAYYNESDQRLYRVFSSQSLTTAPITQTDTKWRILSGETYNAGTSNLVLVMYNVNPSYINALTTESLNDTYSSIYLLGGNELTGTWHNIARENDFNSDTGLYDLRWYISSYATQEYIFHHKINAENVKVTFIKQRVSFEGVSNFENQYYFDSGTPGDYYVSTDGTNYISKNGDTSLTGALSSVPNAKKITDAQDKRTVTYTQSPNRDTGEIDINVELLYEDSTSYGNSTPTENSIANGSMAYIQGFGEPDLITKYIGSYKAVDLPSSQDVSGTVASGGRSKSIKRVVNARVDGNAFSYDLYEDIYTAPQDAGDAWFIHSSVLTWQKTHENVSNIITDNAGNAGWAPIDVGSVGGPKIYKVEIAQKRPKTTVVYRKYFVRYPIAADLDTASINTTGGNEMTTAASDTTISTSYKTTTLGKHLYAVEKTVTTLGSVTADSDGLTGTTGGSKSAGSQLT